MDSRPIGVFDSGMGGLTVLHECLVTMPHEDFVYLGDGARLPYGPRPLDEVRRFALEIAGYLEAQGVKLILVACNSATSAALPDLQERLPRDRVGKLRQRPAHLQSRSDRDISRILVCMFPPSMKRRLRPIARFSSSQISPPVPGPFGT